MGIEDLAGDRCVAVLHHILAAQLEWVHADCLGNHIHVLLEGPVDLRRRRSAHRAGRLMVRVDDAGFDVAAWDAVRPGSVHRSELRKEATVGGVGTIVDQERAAAASDRAVALDARLEGDDHTFAAMVGCDELLAAREDELGRALGLAGDSGDVCLEVELALATKATAKVGDDHAHGVLGHLERVGNTSAGVERHLR